MTKTTREKFRWWASQIEKEEGQLLYILHKIFRSYRLQFQLFDRYSIGGDAVSEIAAHVDIFSTTNTFEENAQLFNAVYRSSIDRGLFEIQVPHFDLIERMRKTQYHIWRLFDKSRHYNTLVRQYNDRIHWPSRYLVAKAFGYNEKSFFVNEPWYHDPSSIQIVGICGPSCSGKSTVCRSLKQYFGAEMVQLDRFFRKETCGRYDGHANWETPDSLMMDRLVDCLHQLKHGEPTLVPSKGWTEVFDRIIYPKPIIFVEGFLLFLNKDLNSQFDVKILINVNEDSILHRRMQRNGAEAWDYTVKCVIPNYVKIRPRLVHKADYIINGDEDPATVRHEVKRIVEDCCT